LLSGAFDKARALSPAPVDTAWGVSKFGEPSAQVIAEWGPSMGRERTPSGHTIAGSILANLSLMELLGGKERLEIDADRQWLTRYCDHLLIERTDWLRARPCTAWPNLAGQCGYQTHATPAVSAR